MKRYWLTVSLLLVLTVGTSFVSAQKVLEIVLHDFQSARDYVEDTMIPQFEALHPGVEVNAYFMGWGDYTDYYVARHIAGMAPDVIAIGSSGLGVFAEQGLIQSIDHFVEQWSGVDDFVPPAWRDVTYGDKIYGVPYSLGVRSLVYRRDIFEESGLDADQPPETWDDLSRLAGQLVRKEADGTMTRRGLNVQSNWQFVIPFLFQAGVQVWDEGNTTDIASLNAVDTFDFLTKLVYEDEVSTLHTGSLMGAFVAGEAAMMWAGPAIMEVTHGQTALPPETLGVALPPKYNVQTTQMHIDKFAVSSQSQHPELAWAWIEYFMEPEHLAHIADLTGMLPPRVSVSQMHPFDSDPRWQTWFETALVARPIPGYIPTWSAMLKDVLIPAFNDIMHRRTPVNSRLEEAARQAELRFTVW